MLLAGRTSLREGGAAAPGAVHCVEAWDSSLPGHNADQRPATCCHNSCRHKPATSTLITFPTPHSDTCTSAQKAPKEAREIFQLSDASQSLEASDCFLSAVLSGENNSFDALLAHKGSMGRLGDRSLMVDSFNATATKIMVRRSAKPLPLKLDNTLLSAFAIQSALVFPLIEFFPWGISKTTE